MEETDVSFGLETPPGGRRGAASDLVQPNLWGYSSYFFWQFLVGLQYL